MCCPKCTAGGISTPWGEEVFNNTSPDERWKLHCPKMTERNSGDDRIMWGMCRVSRELEKVECCKKCEYFF